MSHTIVEMYVKVVPVNLYRNGAKNSPQLYKLRTMPPKTLEQSFDIQIYKNNGITFLKILEVSLHLIEKSWDLVAFGGKSLGELKYL